jgi:exopolysaccharide biosynthesis protein
LTNIGSVVEVSTALSRDLSKASAAIGGGPLLVHKSKAQEWPTERGTNTYLLPRHPRTALGYNSRYFFLVEVDGRQKEFSMGMSFTELAAFMNELGCTEAMNLDGGGSSTFWLNGKVMNSPSDKHERSLANAIIISHKPQKGR